MKLYCYISVLLGLLSTSLEVIAVNTNYGQSGGAVNSTSDISVLSSSNVNVCYADIDRGDIYIELMNTGSDTIFSLALGWYFTTDQLGNSTWAGVILPGGSKTVLLTQLYFPLSGDYTVQLWAKLAVADQSVTNDSTNINVHVYPQFELDILTDTMVCTGQNVPVAIPGGYSSYGWSTGLAGTNTVISSPGTYRVSVTNMNGCVSVDSMNFGFFLAPTDVLPDDTILCEGAILSPELDEDFVSFDWGNNDTSNIIISQEGNYQVTVIDTMGCSYSDTINVQYAMAPSPTVTPQVVICEGDTTVINVNTGYSSYIWSTGATSSSIVTGSSGMYYVTVTGSSGCLGMDSILVLVNPKPVISFNDSVMCNLTPLVFDVGIFESYQWSNGAVNNYAVASSPGKYHVTVTDQNGCEANDSIVVININVSVDLGKDTSICTGEYKLLKIYSLFDSYLWDDGHNGASQWIAEGGTYSITVSLGGCTAVDEIEVEEFPFPVADFSEFVTSPDVQFTNLSNITSLLTWDFGDGTISNLVNPFHQYQNPGNYTVTLEARNMCDTVSYTSTVGVFPLATGNIFVNDNLILYPTIAQDILYFTFSKPNLKVIKYEVFDVSGKILFQENVLYNGPEYVYSVNVSRYASGSYYVRIVGDQELVAVKPFIKK